MIDGDPGLDQAAIHQERDRDAFVGRLRQKSMMPMRILSPSPITTQLVPHSDFRVDGDAHRDDSHAVRSGNFGTFSDTLSA
ncbi:hypothetical protein L905_11710 [Agrobacterium sp. TS43]|nr:hypothetical protein L906_22160 [Agrobacterium sp. TS45]KVK66326.1 hypothetical protein L907_22120 [Agrobacterium sp. C13]KVK70203.1 hypothetical protein L905_11710 [Agrobacterium sp. TS43]